VEKPDLSFSFTATKTSAFISCLVSATSRLVRARYLIQLLLLLLLPLLLIMTAEYEGERSRPYVNIHHRRTS